MTHLSPETENSTTSTSSTRLTLIETCSVCRGRNKSFVAQVEWRRGEIGWSVSNTRRGGWA